MDIKPLDLTPEEIARAEKITTAKTAIAPLKEMETITYRPCCGDTIISYAPIAGVGKPDNFAVAHAALWEDAALAQQAELTEVVERYRAFFETYAFPAKPVEEKPVEEIKPK
jgi:hypothetical protein